MACGALFPWATMRLSALGVSRDFSGLSTTPGKIALGCGIGATLAGGAMLFSWNRRIRLVAPFVAAGLALGAYLLAIGQATHVPGENARIVAESVRQTTGRAPTLEETALVDRQLRTFGFSLSPGFGAAVAASGALLAFSGGAAAAARSSRR
jgi:hypothetical protein